jgi:hypothetical protein
MGKSGRVLAAVALAAAVAGPAAAIDYPQACQPTMSDILYYDNDYNPENGVSGAEVHWCDSHTSYLGHPDVYDWTEWCNPCS